MIESDKELMKNDIIMVKKNKWIWIVGALLICYIISKAFGSDSSINRDDMISLIGQNINNTNKLYGEGKLYDPINAVTYSNGLAVNYKSKDNLEIIYVSLEDPCSERLCNLTIGDSVNTVTEKMNKLDAKKVEEEAVAEYSIEERGYRNYSFEYNGKSMICSVAFKGGIVSRIASYERNSKVNLQ